MVIESFTNKDISLLDKIYKSLKKEQKKLEQVLRCPICIPNCGRCCEVNCVTAHPVEIVYMAQWLKKQPRQFRDDVLNRCYEWLIKKDEYTAMRMGFGTVAMGADELDRFNSELFYLVHATPCPMMTDDKQCLIHPARPIQCRTFGVTRIVPPEVCPRPLGKIEEGRYRAYRNDPKETQAIRNDIDRLVERCKSKPHYSKFLAAGLFLEFYPQHFAEMVYMNVVSTSRIALMGGQGILWQYQVDELTEREQEFQMICNPVPSGPTGPNGTVIEKEVPEEETV